ncbi:AMP-binding protein [Sulfurimonas autotrophica]|uniref:AMP-dependent synthetase and ligase n=1 Tax=Sulfurimonas autotrophica (strain ATCC BAA-671 / DSM 16294 / JCM 11897 / OK10) TaxID=563040 RepID=E0USF7_SULAO|nr:AMP-binding protein [Sulfurimonas autotrophica]ADN09120.1 AMP-dependent synthetase and ligase [Sulfurimonas autotrophica DSM 16294]
MLYPYENIKDFTLPSLLKRSIKLYGSKKVLSKVDQEPMTYEQLNENVQSMIKLLKQNGVRKGDKVALLSENMPNWAVAYFAVTYFGGVIVPILPDFHPADVQHIIRHSEAKAVFVSQKHLQTIEELENSNMKFVIKLDALTMIDDMTNHSYISKFAQKMTSKELPKPHEDDIAALLYTSGTTGHSKGVMLSHKNLVTNAMSAYKNVTVLPEDTFLSILPLAHTFECTVGMILPILHGSDIVYIDKVPTPNVLIKAFASVKPTMMLSVPLIIEKIYKNKILPKFTGSLIMRMLYSIPFIRKILNKIAGKKLIETFGGKIKFFGIGGAALSPYVEKFLAEAEFPYIVGYGLTETSPLIAGGRIGYPIKIGSTGLPMVGVEVQIKDPNPANGEGEIITKSPSVMLGYYKDEEQTKEVIKGGWFYTGDLGYIDEDGYLFISGRSKNVIIGPGGENIYPEQIEAIINQNEAVLDSLVLEQDAKLVARIHLDYELIDKIFKAHNMPENEVRQKIADYLENMRVEINSQLASFTKIQKFIEQIEPFVKTPTKKIKRYLYIE